MAKHESKPVTSKKVVSKAVNREQATSTELTGGVGFTYEDTVVAYYLAALLREERAAGLNGTVKAVAVQQAGQGRPMDDIIVEFDDCGSTRILSLQAKRKVVISTAPTNKDFREILSRAVATRTTPDFSADLDAYGFVTESIAVDRLRTLNRLIDWAKDSPTPEDFARRFTSGGAAAAAERTLRDRLRPLIGAQSPDDERTFYRQFVALNLTGLTEGEVMRAEVINRLQELVAVNLDGLDLLLFDRLCRLARDAAGTGRKWTRQTLLADLRSAVRLKVSPNYRHDIDLLQSLSMTALADVSDEIGGFHVERPLMEDKVRDQLTKHRLINLSGLPGCGKSALLKRIASLEATKGPILFLKSDRLTGVSWLTFATALGLKHHVISDLLSEIGGTGTPILFIDGIDRIRPDQKAIITDALRAIEEDEQLANWKVLASSRDQGLEAYRSWFPASFYKVTGIGDVSVNGFSDEEAELLVQEKPNLRRLLFGPKAVSEIARRPFFASVLARSFPDDSTTPQTEVDLISAWWARAGHDAQKEAVPQRQRALLDLAEKGVRNLGKNIPARVLKDSTFAQIADLSTDLIIREHDGGASYSFTHDIFFEWVFFRQLVDLGDNWMQGLIDAGEPPLLGRVVGLLAQSALASPGKWSKGYRNLEGMPLRPQWRREWLTAPPFTPAFVQAHQEFQALLSENSFALFEKLLVWFQAQHTTPSPVVLQNATAEGLDRISMADFLGWPSDFQGWGRLLDWLLPLAPGLPAHLLPHVLEVFGVWQNILSDLKNPRSADLIDICANWLIELEAVEYSKEFSSDSGRWVTLGVEARSRLATALRAMILRSARSYPSPAIALFERAITDKRMRNEAYSDLIGFTPIMADVAPEIVVAVAKAELMEELPQEKLDREEREYREYAERLQRLRAIPEEERTEEQKLALQHTFVPMYSTIDHYDIGIDAFHRYYFPESPLHEPFASLFAKRPEVALGLVRDLINHATEGWRQVQLLSYDRGATPIPLLLEFPWGTQQFWGDTRVYAWFMGYAHSQPLNCAFLALSYWAFKQLESGQPTDEVIRAVIEGNTCNAALGLALLMALETYNVSEVTFPIVTCQRLWHHDISRRAQESMRDMEFPILGISPPRLTNDKAEAKKFLYSRESRWREIRELAVRFALTVSKDLRQRFKDALAHFPENLPYEFEEESSIPQATESLREDAENWAGLGDIENYRQQQTNAKGFMISYESPNPLTPAQERRFEDSTNSLREYSIIAWATKSFEANCLIGGQDLDDAVAFARSRDSGIIFKERSERAHSTQAMISAVATVVVRFGSPAGPDYDWAWDVMRRVEAMREPKDTFHGSKIPWHPTNHLIVALVHDRRSSSPRTDSVRRLLKLTLHPVESVATLAFNGLFVDSDAHVQWVAAQLAMDLSLYYRSGKSNKRDGRGDLDGRKRTITDALARLKRASDDPLTSVPPAWVKTAELGRHDRSNNEAGWGDANPSFNAAFAARIFQLFPIEAWCRSNLYRPMVAESLKQLVGWTAEQLMPPWLKDRHRRRSDTDRGSLVEWNGVLGDLLAQAAPFFEAEYVRKEFLAPFLTEDEEGLAVLAGFANRTVCRHVLDALVVPANTFELLKICVERVISDRAFDPNSSRAGRVEGFDLPRIIKGLLFVSVEEAPGAARFVNGDWSQVSMIMPIVTSLVSAIGWSPFVMGTFLTLCERAGADYPIDAFSTQANSILGSLSNAKGGWAGTRLPARTAAIVQRLADAKYPLHVEQAQALLRVLDALIDLGDRRSAALEQAEAFRGIQAL